jgi:two-component system, NarL family, nitrate/nitrite response regulator NarL
MGEIEMRIVLCDSHAMFAEAFSSLLAQRGHEVVARVRNPSELADLVRTHPRDLKADVVVTDIKFPGLQPEATIRFARAALPDTAITVLTAEASANELRALVAAGVDGIAFKTEGVDEVERVLARVASPLFQRLRSSAHPEVAWSRQARAADEHTRRSGVIERPTPRELEVIKHLAAGQSSATIAAELGMGVATVRTHLQHLFIKFGVHSRLELVALMMREGLFEQLDLAPGWQSGTSVS